MKKTIFLIVTGLLLLVSCSTVNNSNLTEKSTISVSGSGAVVMEADLVTFNIGVSETASTTGEAQQMANKKIAEILNLLRSFDIEDKDISTTNLSFYSDYYWEDGKQVKTGEQVSQNIYVTLRKKDAFASLMDKLGSSVTGITFNNVSFTASDKKEAQEKARRLAYEDAYEKAAVYAESCGLQVGKPVSISEGGAYFSTRVNADAKYEMAAATAEAPAYGTEAPSGQQSVNVNCNITFELI